MGVIELRTILPAPVRESFSSAQSHTGQASGFLSKMPMNPFKEAIANRIVKFSRRQEKRSASIGTDAVECILNAIHASKWRFGTPWRKLESNAEVAGIYKARRSDSRAKSYATEHLNSQDAVLHFHNDGTIDAGTSPKAPKTALTTQPLTRMQIRYAIATIKQTGNLPKLTQKKLLAKGLSNAKIKHLCQQILNHL